MTELIPDKDLIKPILTDKQWKILKGILIFVFVAGTFIVTMISALIVGRFNGAVEVCDSLDMIATKSPETLKLTCVKSLQRNYVPEQKIAENWFNYSLDIGENY